MRDVLGWKGDTLSKFAVDEELAQTCGWVWWHENVLAISDRPSEIHRDEQGRLHSANSPSIAYRDGWSLYHWHSVFIPSEWITDKSDLKAEDVLSCKNLEQRRAGCEILGWDNILEKLNAVVIDTDPDPEIGQLVAVDIPDIGREQFLRVQCGTGRKFALAVPPEIKTALEANAWTYDIPSEFLQKKEHRT